MAKDYRILSIQSHVVSGCCGNKSAVFPLQVLGFEVDFINSVQFSNHTGYPHVKGQVLHAEELHELYEGLKLNKINKYTHVLTGYCGAEDFLEEMVKIIKDLKEVNPGIIYALDPVMGDDGKMYVPQSLLGVFKEKLVPICNIVTPNQYELELLTDTTIQNEDNTLEAMSILHDMGVETVFATSVRFGESNKEIYAYVSTKKDTTRQVFKIELPWIDANFTGTGDLFAACAVAWMTRTSSIQEAFEKTVAVLQGVLQRTHKLAQELADRELDSTKSPEALELRIVHCKDIIENPHSDIKATQVV